MKINQIFESINGEVSIHHQGCNLRCKACDTPYAQFLDQGEEISVFETAWKAAKFENKNITITGGEPLLQREETIELAIMLCNAGCIVSIETNGTSEMLPYHYEMSWVADWKGPSSGMRNAMKLKNYRHLRKTDFVKFVVANRIDFDDAMEVIKILVIDKIKCQFAFSPSYGDINPNQLISWMKEEEILKKEGAIFSWQLHKVLELKEN